MEKKFLTGIGFIIFNVIFFLIIAFLLMDSAKSYRNLVLSVKKDIATLQENTEELAERKKIIQANIAKFTEEEKMERIARDRLNLAKEGETTVRIVK